MKRSLSTIGAAVAALALMTGLSACSSQNAQTEMPAEMDAQSSEAAAPA